MLDILIILLFIVVTSSALILLKLGASSGALVAYKDKKLEFNVNKYSVMGIFLYGFSFLLYIYLISKHDLGFIIPLTTALVYLLIFPASHIIFNEQFTVKKIVGVCFIVIGVVLLNLHQ